MQGTFKTIARVFGRASLIAMMVFPLTARAQEAEEPPTLALELNRTDTDGGACRLTFVVRNTQNTPVEQMVLETVLFTKDGQVALMTLFDFGALPTRSPRVRQFAVPDLSCDAVQSVLVNGISTCMMDGAASTACQENLHVKSASEVELLG